MCRHQELRKVASFREWYGDQQSGRVDEIMEQARRRLEAVGDGRGDEPSSVDEGHSAAPRQLPLAPETEAAAASRRE